MLLSQLFINKLKEGELYRNFELKINKISHIQNQIQLENQSFIIQLDIEDSEDYISFTIRDKINNITYFALSDYSYIDNSVNIFNFLDEIVNKEDFYAKIKGCLKGRWKKREDKLEQLVALVLSLISIVLDRLRIEQP